MYSLWMQRNKRRHGGPTAGRQTEGEDEIVPCKFYVEAFSDRLDQM